MKILGEGEERNFPLGEILPKAKFLCSPLTFTSKITLATISPVADTLRYPPMSKIIFQKNIFSENKANNSTYRHQTQLKCWQWRNTAVAGRPPYHRRIVRDLKLLGAVAFASWRFGDLEIWRLKIFQIILPNSESPNLPVAKAIRRSQ